MIPPAHRNRSCSSKAKLVAISRLGAALFAYTLCVLSVELKDSHLMNKAQTIKIYVHVHLGVLCCFALFVCLILLASFFLPSHLSFKNMYILGLVFGVIGGFITPAFSFILS